MKRFSPAIFLEPVRRLDYAMGTYFSERIHNRLIGFHNMTYRVPEGNYVLVHIPKTAGTSVAQVLATLEDIPVENLRKHCPVSKYAGPDDYPYITIMRDPVERVWSYYNMALRQPEMEPAHHFSRRGLEYFLEHCWEAQNMMCQYMAGVVRTEVDEKVFKGALNNLRSFFCILDFRNLNDDMNKLLQKMGKQHLQSVPHARKSNNQLPTDEEKKKILEYNRYDHELYVQWRSWK